MNKQFREWTKADRDQLRALRDDPNVPNGDIWRRINRSRDSVMGMVTRMGLAKASQQQWTEADDDRLRVLFSTRPMAEIADELGRTEKACTHRAWIIGLKGVQGVKQPKPNKPAPWSMRRSCLSCRRDFDAPTRFLRLCPPCRGAA